MGCKYLSLKNHWLWKEFSFCNFISFCYFEKSFMEEKEQTRGQKLKEILSHLHYDYLEILKYDCTSILFCLSFLLPLCFLLRFWKKFLKKMNKQGFMTAFLYCFVWVSFYCFVSFYDFEKVSWRKWTNKGLWPRGDKPTRGQKLI